MFLSISEHSCSLRKWCNVKGPIIGLEPSDREGQPDYEIRLGKDHRVYCNCASWRYSPAPAKTCKHLKRFNAKIVAAAAAAA